MSKLMSNIKTLLWKLCHPWEHHHGLVLLEFLRTIFVQLTTRTRLVNTKLQASGRTMTMSAESARLTTIFQQINEINNCVLTRQWVGYIVIKQ